MGVCIVGAVVRSRFTMQGGGAENPPPRLPSFPSTVQARTKTFLDATSDALWKRCDKARREPLGTIYLNAIDPAYVNVFEHWVSVGLWRPVMTVSNTYGSLKEFWSPKYEAGLAICRFDEMVDEQHHDEGGGVVVPYKQAGGNLRVVGRGDLTCLLPPFYATFRDHSFGPNKRLTRCSFSLRFSIGVVSACAAIDSDDEEGSNLTSLGLHYLYPPFTQGSVWPQPPPYADATRHFMRHIQRACNTFTLDPRSLAVQAAQSWDCSEPDLFPNNFFCHQRVVNGHVWCETSQRWVMVVGHRGKKERVMKSNGMYWYQQSKNALAAWNDYKRGPQPEESESEEEEYELSDDELEWWCKGNDVPDWAREEKRARMATRASSHAS